MTPEEFWAIWQSAEPESKPPIYRLYYNDDGSPLFYSMEDIPGNYIDIDQETFQRAPGHVRVVDNKLIELKIVITKKLVPVDEFGICCDPRDVSIVVTPDQDHTKWSLRTYG